VTVSAFEGSRLSFSGTVTGDEVAIKGKVTTDDRTLSRDFGASGRLTRPDEAPP